MFLHHSCRACLLFLILAVFEYISSINCQQTFTYNYHICSYDTANDTATATFNSNLVTLLNSLSSKASNSDFYSESSNGIYSLYLCRGDVSSTTCQSCVNDASQELPQRCPSDKTAIIWYDQCMLRYSNVDFLGTLQLFPKVYMWNVRNTTSPDEPNVDASYLMYDLIVKARDAEKKFAAGEKVVADGLQRRYGLVQCRQDIDSTDCVECLDKLVDDAKECCSGKRGWRILGASCNLRYEESKFYEEPSVPPGPIPTAPPPLTDDDGKGGNNRTKIIIITIASFAVAVALLGFWYYLSFYRKKRQKGEINQEILLQNFEGSSHMYLMKEGMCATDEDHSGEMHYFSLTTIQAATNNFSDENKLGEGGFGPVYKGKLPSGKEIAVKRLSMKSKQGLEEFTNEVKLIIKLQHKNLVRLLGYCLEGDEKLLVYEYMANTSLDAFLFDPTKCKELDWARRMNIINGTARGLLYLHEDSRLKIIHRDLKASNVLLDDEMNPKISDFGTARIFGGNQLEASTDKVVGTYGYMAPEYALEGLFSVKSDVYSLGVLMLEVISGKKNKGFYQPEGTKSLLTYAWQLWNEGKGSEVIDPNIVDSCPTSEALRCIHIALLCVQDDPTGRPTMSSVVHMLGSKSVDLPQQSTPPYSVGRYITMSDQSSTIGTGTGTGFLTSDQSSTSVSF